MGQGVRKKGPYGGDGDEGWWTNCWREIGQEYKDKLARER